MTQSSTNSIISEIEEINTRYGNAFANNDVKAFLSCYTPDGCVMPVNMPKLCGEQQLSMFFNAAYSLGIRNIIFTTNDFFGQTDDTVTEEGVYEIFSAAGMPIERGKFLVVWKKTTNGWLKHRHMFTRDADPQINH